MSQNKTVRALGDGIGGVFNATGSCQLLPLRSSRCAHRARAWLYGWLFAPYAVFLVSASLAEETAWEALQAGGLRVCEHGNRIGSLQTRPARLGAAGGGNGVCGQTV